MHKKILIQIVFHKVGREFSQTLCFIKNYINETLAVLLIKIIFQKNENSYSFSWYTKKYSKD